MNEAPGIEPLPPLPPNGATLSVRPAPDCVHTIMRVTYDVTHLSDDKKKLLLFMVSSAITELEAALKKMGNIEAAKKLAWREAASAKGNGQ